MASRWSAGRRRALTLRARAPRDPHPLETLGSRKLGVMTPADRKAGEGSFASSLAPPGAPIPRWREEGNRADAPASQTTGATTLAQFTALFEICIGDVHALATSTASWPAMTTERLFPNGATASAEIVVENFPIHLCQHLQVCNRHALVDGVHGLA